MSVKFTLSAALSAAAYLAFAGVPQASNVVLTQDAESHAVTISYALAESAIVTADIQTNGAAAGWVSLGGDALRSMTGDVHKNVAAGTHTISWPTLPGGAQVPTLPRRKHVRAVITTWVPNAPPDYLVLDLSGQEKPAYYAEEKMLPQGGSVTNDVYKERYLVMRRIHAAGVAWLMGANEAETNNDNKSLRGNAVPHDVMLTRDYYIGVYPVTSWQGTYLWKGVITAKDHKPVNNLKKSWAGNLAQNASTLSGMPGIVLPTEAQWEFAARGGCPTDFYTGKPMNSANMAELGGSWASSRHEVGTHVPNAYGIHDMLGCIQQPVSDNYEDWSTCNGGGPIARQPVVVDPQGPATGTDAVFRGGYYGWGWPHNTVSHRQKYASSTDSSVIGARLALPL